MATGGGAAPQPRRRFALLAAGGVLLVAAAVVAGVFGSQAANKRKPQKGVTVIRTESVKEDPYLALVQANQYTIPTIIASTPGSTTNLTAVDPNENKASDTDNAGVLASDVDTRAPWQKMVDAALEEGNSDSSSGAVAITAPNWKQAGGASRGICYPIQDEELIAMATDPTRCTIIVLSRVTRDPAYNIKETMNITTLKIIIGNPIAPPDLDGAKGERIFDILPGGVLDLRSVFLDRGRARQIGDLRLVAGGTVRCHVGGTFIATGVIFREQLQTTDGFQGELREALRQRQRTFGGHMLILGGNVYLNGCIYFGFRQLGSPVVNNFAMGRELLIVAGNGIALAPTHLNGNTYGISTVVGQIICVLSGTYTWIGGQIANEVVAQAQAAVGSIIFIGTGVVTIVGLTYGTVTGAGWRHNFGQYSVGGGVLIKIGFATASVWGVSARAWAGSSYSVGGGLLRFVGVTQFSATTADFGVGAGGNMFIGGGIAGVLGLARYSTRIALFNAGIGFGSWLGGGMYNNRLNPSVGIDVCRSQFGIASDIAVGGGWINYINNTRINYQVARAWFGLGNTIWLGLGGGIVAKGFQVSIRYKTYSNTPFSFTIGGVGYSRSQGTWPNNVIVNHKTGRPLPNNKLDDVNDKSGATEAAEINKKAADKAAKKAAKEAAKANSTAKGTSRFLEKVQDAVASGMQKVDELPVSIIDMDVRNYGLDPSKININKLSKSMTLDVTANMNNVKKMIKSSIIADKASGEWSINLNKTEGNALVCSLQPPPSSAHVENNGDSKVVVSDKCQGATASDVISKAQRVAPFALNANLLHTRGLAEGSGVGDADLPATNFVWYKVTSRCKSIGDGCADSAVLKTALKELLNTPKNLEFTVTSGSLPKIAQGLATPQLLGSLASAEDPNCPEAVDSSIFITLDSEKDSRKYQDALDAISKDTTALRAKVEDILEEDDSGVSLCSLELKKVAATNYPNYANWPAFNAATIASFHSRGPNVVVGADDSIAPLSELVAGREYNAFIMNFPAGSKVDVFMVKAMDDLSGPPMFTIEDFDDDGASQIKFIAPASTQKHFLLARQKDLPAFFGFSTAFSVVDTETHPGRRW